MNKDSYDVYFECAEEFADFVVGRVEECEGLFVSVVGKFDSIKSLLKDVMTYEFVDFESIEIESEIMDGYADEFVLSLWMEDDVLKIGCEKAKRDGEYVYFCGDETYLMEDCSSKVIPLCEDSKLYFVNFDEEYGCYEECDECCPCDCCCSDREATDAEKSLHYIYWW